MNSRFAIGEGYAVYRGPTTAGTLHRHAGFQILIGMPGEVSVVDGSDVTHRAAALIVPTMQSHCLLAAPDVLVYFVEPYCAFADTLRRRYGDAIAAAPELCALTENDLRPVGGRGSDQLDPRLAQALKALSDSDIPIPEVAADVELSPQRLRALAREQLGMPLARWRVWTRLRRAAEALQSGESLADAAAVSGFADQAHLSRRMREMMGLTPSALLPLVRAHSLPAT